MYAENFFFLTFFLYLIWYIRGYNRNKSHRRLMNLKKGDSIPCWFNTMGTLFCFWYWYYRMYTIKIVGQNNSLLNLCAGNSKRLFVLEISLVKTFWHKKALLHTFLWHAENFNASILNSFLTTKENFRKSQYTHKSKSFFY